MDGQLEEWICGWMDGQIDRGTDVQMAGTWDGELGKWTDGYMKE